MGDYDRSDNVKMGLINILFFSRNPFLRGLYIVEGESMDYDLGKFLTANASAIFALIGVLGGGLLSFFGSLILKKREFNLTVFGKLLDRRIAAHENVISLAIKLRVMVPLGGESFTGEVRRAPEIMFSRSTFDEWLVNFSQLGLSRTTWLSYDAKREINFIQDYFVTLNMYLESVPSDKFLELGELIRLDFINLSSSLEKKAFAFFHVGIRKLQPDSLDKWHKYQLSETKSRLSATSLVRNEASFIQARNAHNPG
ncbi:hypothetical protein [Rahnella aquatilis]|uniref:hypothetical protein n=1 Tax=Rahnella aquatilis TaxID=34038 RepID=UPI00064647F2|nr:hypothetical protein [Rahnella aquatilis]